MTNEERARALIPNLYSHFNGMYCDQAGINMIADLLREVRLDEAEWWARPIESVEGIWRSIEEQRERIAALREGRKG